MHGMMRINCFTPVVQAAGVRVTFPAAAALQERKCFWIPKMDSTPFKNCDWKTDTGARGFEWLIRSTGIVTTQDGRLRATLGAADKNTPRHCYSVEGWNLVPLWGAADLALNWICIRPQIETKTSGIRESWTDRGVDPLCHAVDSIVGLSPNPSRKMTRVIWSGLSDKLKGCPSNDGIQAASFFTGVVCSCQTLAACEHRKLPHWPLLFFCLKDPASQRPLAIWYE